MYLEKLNKFFGQSFFMLGVIKIILAFIGIFLMFFGITNLFSARQRRCNRSWIFREYCFNIWIISSFINNWKYCNDNFKYDK